MVDSWQSSNDLCEGCILNVAQTSQDPRDILGDRGREREREREEEKEKGNEYEYLTFWIYNL